MKKYDKIFIIITASIVLADQLLKLLMKSLLSSPITIINNFLSLNLITNTGAGFSLLKNSNSMLIWISFLIIGAIFYYYDTIQKEYLPFIALIVGGAVGNLIDRIFLGHVIDYINFTFWPAFNLADSAVTIGVIILIILMWKKK